MSEPLPEMMGIMVLNYCAVVKFKFQQKQQSFQNEAKAVLCTFHASFSGCSVWIISSCSVMFSDS